MPAGTEAVARALAFAGEEVDRLERELSEIVLLDQQIRQEIARHERRRGQAADRLTAVQARGEPAEVREATEQLVTLTARSGLMQAQADILEGKQKALTRFRDHLTELIGMLGGGAEAAESGDETPAEESGRDDLARAVVTAQEDLRRDIARAMHDGPAQSLTNIILQAQIVERLVGRDQERAMQEVRLLVDMVQKTLESTKTFIFDVRPMVLDDLGVVPTLRRAARDRGQRARIPIEFESTGPDRRLAPDLESGIFRVVDEALTGFIATQPSRITIRLEWKPQTLRARVRSVRTGETELALPPGSEPPAAGAEPLGSSERGEDLPPLLAAMIQERHDDDVATRSAAAEQAAKDSALPARSWREIEQRASTAGLEVSLAEGGRCVEMVAELAGSPA